MLYGATPIEDIPYYNVIVRQLTEWTGTNQQGSFDQTSINEGIGGVALANKGSFGVTLTSGQQNVNVRQKYIQGVDMTTQYTVSGTGVITLADAGPVGAGIVPNTSVASSAGAIGTAITPIVSGGANAIHPNVTFGHSVRRYQIQLALGIFNQEKLIPTKFMASQLAIEITLENAAACLYYQPSALTAQPGSGMTTNGLPSSTPPSYIVSNVNLIPEILEFDASYDESFLRGLQTGGVPIKFATWNNYRFSTNGVSSINLQIQERSRSVKSIFCMQRRDPPTFSSDSGASFFNTSIVGAACPSTFQEYQYRIGGRYFPSQPVQCSTQVGGTVPNTGSEAYVELAKALNTLGDYRLSAPINSSRWALNAMATSPTVASTHTLLPEFDYDYDLVTYKYTGSPVVVKQSNAVSSSYVLAQASGLAGNLGSCCFAMAIDLETSNGMEISGLNAEEQSDISLIARFSAGQASGFVFDVFTYIDSMIVLRENNVLILLTIGVGTYSISKMYVSLINGRLWLKPNF